MRVVDLEDELACALPGAPAVLIASSPAREAVLALTSGEPRSTPAVDHLRRVIVDEATTAPEQPLHLPEPRDPRLHAVARGADRDK